MGLNTTIENITLNLTSSSDVYLTGVRYVNGTPISGVLLSTTINVISTASSINSINSINGVLVDGTTSNAIIVFTAIRNSSINITSASKGESRGILNTGINYFAISDTNIFCGGTGLDLVGVQANNSTGITSIKSSSINGVTNDIYRNSGSTLLLHSTDLVNGTNVNSFSVNSQTQHSYYILGSALTFSGSGDVTNTLIGTYYLKPGSTPSNFASIVTGTPFAQKSIIFNAMLSSSIAMSGLQQAVATFYKSTVISTTEVQYATLTINSMTQTSSFINTSISFNALTDFLQIRIVITGANLSPGCDIIVAVATY